MSHQNTRGGIVVGICFMTLWCGTAFGMGIMAMNLGAPFFFTMVAFGMGLFGIVLSITICRQGFQSSTIPRRSQDGYMTYTGDYTSPYSQTTDRKSYGAPPFCPSCGNSISTDEVDWVAPLKAVCPYCEAVIDAVERF